MNGLPDSYYAPNADEPPNTPVHRLRGRSTTTLCGRRIFACAVRARLTPATADPGKPCPECLTVQARDERGDG